MLMTACTKSSVSAESNGGPPISLDQAWVNWDNAGYPESDFEAKVVRPYANEYSAMGKILFFLTTTPDSINTVGRRKLVLRYEGLAAKTPYQKQEHLHTLEFHADEPEINSMFKEYKAQLASSR